ncbi:hypothetical protein F4781DRAFT_64436 [Annulohypoxylon bovei var. microspora]|nr:hypothetical protein F4781DRAFT_64436 [Annulohypoxylon bovei var. microspora]
MMPSNAPADVTGSMVVEVGSGTINDGAVEKVKEAKSCDLDSTSWGVFSGDIICYSPWDEENLFSRVINSEVGHEHSMGNYKWYISCLLKIIYSVRKPLTLGYSREFYSTGYETDKHEISCPSLTNDSTISESPIWVRKTLGRLGRSDARISLEDKMKREENIKSPSFQIRKQVEVTALRGLGARFWPYNELDIFSLSDPETPTDTSSEDDDEDEDDPFNTLHQAIRQAFSSNTQLAEKVIDYLHQLPLDRQQQIYGYGAMSLHGGDRTGHSDNPDCNEDSTETRKRKRKSNEASPSGSGSNQVDEGNDQENQLMVARRPSAAPIPQKRYACAYYKSDGAKYGPRAATRYKSCGGPGFKVFNHYKRHLERVHLLHQCSRCGVIFEKPDELHNHLAQDPRCNRSEGIEREGMSQQRWDELKQIFKRNRGGHQNPSDVDRWFLAWDVLFPGIDRPPTPYYEKPPLPLVFTQIQGVFEASLNSLPQVARDSDLQYGIMSLLENAINAATQSAPLEFEGYDHNIALIPPPDTINVHQMSDIGANQHNPTPIFNWGTTDPIEQPAYIGNEPFLDDLFNINTFDADAEGT